MNDSEGITITSDKDIVIQVEENLTAASGKTSHLIAADDRVQVKQGNTSMTLSGDISLQVESLGYSRKTILINYILQQGG